MTRPGRARADSALVHPHFSNDQCSAKLSSTVFLAYMSSMEFGCPKLSLNIDLDFISVISDFLPQFTSANILMITMSFSLPHLTTVILQFCEIFSVSVLKVSP